MKRDWYHVANAAADSTTVEIHIIDFIGDWIDDYYRFGVTAKAFIAQLAALPAGTKTVKVHINSPGGDVFAALNIANALRALVAKGIAVETIVDGLAASAASIVLMAGSTVRMADNAMVMVHNPWSVAVGNAAEMRKAADTLDAIRNTLVTTYQWHSTLDAAALIALLDAETWMDADEAIAHGFATDKIDGLHAAASLDARAIATLTVPEKYRARLDALVVTPAPPVPDPIAASATEVLRACTAGGCLELAEAMLSRGDTLDTVTATITETTTAKAAALAAAAVLTAEADSRATAIRAICATARQPELVDGYLAGGMTADAVRAHMTVITAKLDRIEIDGGLLPDTRNATHMSPAAIYAARNR